MRRIIICIALLCGIILTGFYSSYKITYINENVTMHIDAITVSLNEEDHAAVIRNIDALRSFWDAEETTLMHFVKHGEIDNVSFCIAKLPSLAAYGNFSDLSSELASIRRQVEHIKNSELPILDNIL